MRGYYRWLGRTMMAIAVLLAVFWTLLVLALAGDPTVEHSVTFEDTMAPLLAVYAISAVAILIGRVLARIAPDK